MPAGLTPSYRHPHPGVFTKDQWELQMQARALDRVGAKGLHFVTDGLPAEG
jgi:hypothetical protein